MTKNNMSAPQAALTPLMTVPEVAGLLKVSVRTLRRHIAAGGLSVLRIGRSIRVTQEAISAFMTTKDRG